MYKHGVEFKRLLFEEAAAETDNLWKLSGAQVKFTGSPEQSPPSPEYPFLQAQK